MDFADPKHWGRIEPLFAQAIELPAAARPSFLETACSGDPALRDALEGLLGAHESATDFLASVDPAHAAALLRAVPDDEAPPDEVGPYRIDRRVGSGGMGVVYLAHDQRLDRPVALKLLRGRYGGADERARERLMAEARAASALDHPNIVPVYEVGELPDGRLFIAMAWAGDGSLADRLRGGALPSDEALQVARQLADALAAAHRRGIVHRDVKPANILLSEGRARLVDFGVALVTGRDADEPSGAAGTLAYMSPEQTRGADVDARSDVWSLGVVLYEMLAGQRPFPSDDAPALIHSIRYHPPEPLRTRRPDVPETLARLVDRCLTKKTSQRPADAAAVLAELDALGQVRVAPRIGPARRVGIAAGAVVVLVAAAIGALTLRQGRTAADTDQATLAVLPFAAVGGDTALQRLGRELAITLGTSLDGAAGIRIVEPIAVLARAEGTPNDIDSAARLARELGAARMIHGTLARSGTMVRFDAAVFGLEDSSTPIARATATAPFDDVTALTDSAAVRLLIAGWQARDARAPGLAALTTSSVPALRAYLEGELAIAGARFRAAPLAFARAIAEDSTFWFAYWRYMYARDYHGEPVDSAIIAAVREHRAAFPEPDRLLIESRFTDTETERIAGLRTITERFPSYWPAWFDLGDALTHHGVFLGLSFDEAAAALDRAIQLSPRFVPALEHRFWIAIQRRDSARSGALLARMTELRLDSLLLEEWDLATLDYYTYLDHLARNRGRPRPEDSAFGASVLAAYTGPLDPERLATSLSGYGFHRAQLEIGRGVLERAAPAAIRAAQSWAAAVAWAGRGAWDSVPDRLNHYLAATADPRAPIRSFGLAVIGTWLGALPTDALHPLRESARRSDPARTPAGAAEIAWLDALVAFVRADPAALPRQRAAVQASLAPAAPTLAASIAALEAALDRGTAEAARSILSLELRNADDAWAWRHGPDHPWLSAVHRATAGHWLLDAGDPNAAARLLVLTESDLPGTIQTVQLANILLGTYSLPALARLEHERGQAEAATRARALFAERADLASANWPSAWEPAFLRSTRHPPD